MLGDGVVFKRESNMSLPIIKAFLMKILVYLIKDGVTGAPVYVGHTSKRLNKRLNEHMSNAKTRPSQRLHDFINKSKVRPTIELIESVEVSETFDELALAREDYWIQKYKSDGFDLMNEKRAKRQWTPGYIEVSTTDMEIIIARRKFIPLVAKDLGFSMHSAHATNIIENGRVRKDLYDRLLTVVARLKEMDFSYIAVSHRNCMVKLSQEQLQHIRKNKAIPESTRRYIAKSGLIRKSHLDKLIPLTFQ